jgi:bifunctional non-homologous end joining protein LigD
MLCQTGSIDDLSRAGWVGETKYDGTRGTIIKKDKKPLIQNRKGINYTRRLPEITETAENINGNFTIDGEICFFNDKGITVFVPCQRRCATTDLGKIWFLKQKFPLTFMAFDILELNGQDLRREPYWKRKEILEQLLDGVGSNIKYAELSKHPKRLFQDIIQRGGEGIILKQLESPYLEGIRTYSWLKVKLEQKAVCDVIGYTRGQNSRSSFFGALLLSQNGKYVGKAGSGFSDYELATITEKLKQCKQTKGPSIGEEYTAIKTDMKVLVRYHKRTKDGVFRFPVFLKVEE